MELISFCSPNGLNCRTDCRFLRGVDGTGATFLQAAAESWAPGTAQRLVLSTHLILSNRLLISHEKIYYYSSGAFAGQPARRGQRLGGSRWWPRHHQVHRPPGEQGLGPCFSEVAAIATLQERGRVACQAGRCRAVRRGPGPPPPPLQLQRYRLPSALHASAGPQRGFFDRVPGRGGCHEQRRRQEVRSMLLSLLKQPLPLLWSADGLPGTIF